MGNRRLKSSLLLKCFGASAILLLAAAGASIAASNPNSTVYYITATISNCCDAGGLNFTLQSDGSSSAVYSSGSGVTSELAGYSEYEWDLDLSQSSRSFLLTLIPVNGSLPGPLPGTMAFNGKLFSRCFDSSNNVSSWLKIQTLDATCAMRANFTYGNTKYTLVMSPTYSGTGTATVTCTKWNKTACSAWTDVPTVNVANAKVAHLYTVSKTGTETYVGSYELSFNISMTNP